MKAPGFNPCTYEVEIRFQILTFKCNLYRYSVVRAIAYDHGDRGWAWQEVGTGGKEKQNNNDGEVEGGAVGSGGAAPAAAAWMQDRFGSVEGLRTSLLGAPPSSSPARHPSDGNRDDAVVFEMATSRQGPGSLCPIL